MARITLYADKINRMYGLIEDVKKSVIDYNSELFSLKTSLLSINKSVCNTDDIISSIQASSQIQEEKIASLDTLKKNVEQFVTDTVRIDSEVADLIRNSKNKFYEEHENLRPECEKNGWEEFWDGLNATEWCKEHWKLMATAGLVALAIALVCTGVGGPFAAIILGACKGLIIGAAAGGVLGGTMSALFGGSISEGFENGAFAGAIAGIISGGMGVAMSLAGTVALTFGKTVISGGVSGVGVSLIGDLGDKFIKEVDISWGQMFVNMATLGTIAAVFAGVGYGISKGISALKVKFGGEVTSLENGPYIKDGKPNGRPSPSGKVKLEFEQAVYKNQVGRDGILRDTNTGKVLDWIPGQPRNGNVDFGHNAGKNYSKVFENYKTGKITLEQLTGFQSNPKNFRIEDFSTNRSHLFEKTFFDSTKGFSWSSSASNSALNSASEYLYGN